MTRRHVVEKRQRRAMLDDRESGGSRRSAGYLNRSRAGKTRLVPKHRQLLVLLANVRDQPGVSHSTDRVVENRQLPGDVTSMDGKAPSTLTEREPGLNSKPQSVPLWVTETVLPPTAMLVVRAIGETFSEAVKLKETSPADGPAGLTDSHESPGRTVQGHNGPVSRRADSLKRSESPLISSRML
jgi:hypothetical protein